jgi:hypothetical protein
MKKKFGQFKIELGHGGQNGTPMRKWDTDGKMGHRWENGTQMGKWDNFFFFMDENFNVY